MVKEKIEAPALRREPSVTATYSTLAMCASPRPCVPSSPRIVHRFGHDLADWLR